MARQRYAKMTNVETGESERVLRGTGEYEKLKQEGWLSREQISHRKEYQEDWTPDYLDDEDFEDWSDDSVYDDFPDVDEEELLVNRIQDMFDQVYGVIQEIPNEKQIRRNYVSLIDTKDTFVSLLKDLYAKADSDDDANAYLIMVLPTIEELVALIRWDSTQEDLDVHITQLATVLEGGALDSSLAKALGDTDSYQGVYSGWYEKGSRYSDTFSRAGE